MFLYALPKKNKVIVVRSSNTSSYKEYGFVFKIPKGPNGKPNGLNDFNLFYRNIRK